MSLPPAPLLLPFIGMFEADLIKGVRGGIGGICRGMEFENCGIKTYAPSFQLIGTTPSWACSEGLSFSDGLSLWSLKYFKSFCSLSKMTSAS